MMCKSNVFKSKGFTLIELLVVISIIAALLSIMLPALKKAKEQAQKIVCSSNLHQWALAMRTYASDYRDCYPYRAYFTGPYFWHEEREFLPKEWRFSILDTFIKPYLGNDKKYTLCPSYKHSFYIQDWDVQIATNGTAGGTYNMWVGFKREQWPATTYPWPNYFPRDKTSNCPAGMAVASDVVRYDNALSGWAYGHPFREIYEIEPSGMNGAFNDGSSRWVPFDDMQIAFHNWSNSISDLYWPNPGVRDPLPRVGKPVW